MSLFICSHIMLILQYKALFILMIGFGAAFVLFIFMLVLLCFLRYCRFSIYSFILQMCFVFLCFTQAC